MFGPAVARDRLLPVPGAPPAPAAFSTLVRLSDVDHCLRDALVALDGDEIVAVARYNAVVRTAPTRTRDAEIALTVEDAWQRRGVGRRLVRRLGVLAARRGLTCSSPRSIPTTAPVLALMRDLVPDATVWFSSGEYQARLPLAPR